MKGTSADRSRERARMVETQITARGVRHRRVLDAMRAVPREDALRYALLQPRLERAIGVIYRPESELLSHYFEAQLPRQFDAWLWLEETSAVTPLAAADLAGAPDTYPFGL